MARILLVLWGGFWTWFVAMELMGNLSPKGLYHGAAVIVPIWIACTAGWLNARVGSFVVLGIAALMALYFKHPLVWTPPILAGLILTAGRFYGKK